MYGIVVAMIEQRTAFNQDIRVLVMERRDNIGVRVVEFLMGARTRVWRSGYL